MRKTLEAMLRPAAVITALCLGLIAAASDARTAPGHAKFSLDDGSYLLVEVLRDDLFHFEYSAKGPGPDPTAPIHASVMVDKRDYPGSSSQSISGNVVQTKELRATVDKKTLCVSLRDKARAIDLSTICPQNLSQDWKSLTLTQGKMSSVYGLGQQFKTPGSADGDWVGRIREAQPNGQEQAHGNGFMPFGSAGMVGNVQIPVMYAVGTGGNYALFLDNVYKQEWDFRASPWVVSMWGDQVRFYVMSGPDLADLRKDYLELVGRPPVPPRKAFGLWVSEFGYKNWPQIEALRDGLRADGFPVDGFVLDLFWFGGVTDSSPDSAMGKLDWDSSNSDGNDYYFPDPGSKIQELSADHVGLVAIEESYVAKNKATYSEISSGGRTPFAYRQNERWQCDPASYQPVELSKWFGTGGMLDWSDPAVGPWIHANRRFPNLVEKGVIGHWTDLGEPEKYDPSDCYDGVEPGNRQHGDIHNIYNFLWNRSIYEGYREKNGTVNRRPFIMTRSGAAGSQRFGAAMWSGDIGSNLDILATHFNAQLHMSFSGIDYYGSDNGGFRREGMPYNSDHKHRQYEDELYTQWLANGAWFDVPVRPHTDNAFQKSGTYQTAPNLVGAKASNLANLRQRYELIPYYYSLAYRAHLMAEPVVAPLVFYYQKDPNVRTIGHEKLLGRDLLVGVVAQHGEYQRDVYLPAGTWVNYHSNEWIDSTGQWLRGVPVYRDGLLRLPAFARAGAILPQMRVSEQTLDAYDDLKTGGTDTDLVVRVFPSEKATTFTLYEDDGATLAFDDKGKPVYQTRTTAISQQLAASRVTVAIAAASGTYPSAPASRDNEVRLVLRDRQVAQVLVNGSPAALTASEQEYRAASGPAYLRVNDSLVYARSGSLGVDGAKTFEFSLTARAPKTSLHFVCDNGWTQPGETVAAVGNIPELGGWQPASAPALQPNVYYKYITDPPGKGPGPATPKWTGVIDQLPAQRTIEWKCVLRNSSGEAIRWESGDNHVVTTGAAGFSGSTQGQL